MGTKSSKQKKKSRKNKFLNLFSAFHKTPHKNSSSNHPRIIHNDPQCSISEFIGWIKKDTTLLAFYNKITNHGTTAYCDINNTILKNHESLLHIACNGENIAITKALLSAGAFVNKTRGDGFTPLDMALRRNNFALVRLLINHGGITLRGISRYLKYSQETLQNLADDYNSTDKRAEILCIREYLLKHSIKDFGDINYDQQQLFSNALENNDVDAAKEILKTPMLDANACIFISSTRIATKNGNLEMVKLLVEYGAVIIDDSNWGDTIAEFARQLGHDDIANFLDETQTNRYKRLKLEAELPKKYQLFSLGLFSDTSSNLYNELSSKQSDISEVLVKRMLSFEYS